MAWTMPSETDPHDRIWMAFPPLGSSVTETAESAAEARDAWTAVAHAVLEFEPVTMVVDPGDVADARRMLSADIDLVEAPLDDAWMRDIGPTFVHGDDGHVAGVDWIFNGWGAQEWAVWDRDKLVARAVLEAAGIERVESTIVNEGGGIHVDGAGTVLVTETVQLGVGRNPGATKGGIEAELRRTLGVTNIIWLPRGLYRDAQRYGTIGHVDIVATIPSPGRILVHAQLDEAHPDAAILRDIVAALSSSADASGGAWDIIEVPAPATLRDDEDWVDYSYINHLVVNGGVIAGSFGDVNDSAAAGILADAYPGRKVVAVDSRPIFARGGGIHCITQHQPSPRS